MQNTLSANMNYFVLIFLFFLYFLKKELVSSSCLDVEEYDYIIVGAGSAGSMIATRLSENTTNTVLVLEAGGEPAETQKIPLLAFDALRTRMDWNHSSTPQKHCCGVYNYNTLPLFRGKMLGGSGSINSMAFNRCNKKDFDSWEQQGNLGWSYKDVLPYFLKLENYLVPHPKEDDQYHALGGPITVGLPDFRTPMAQAFLDAGTEIGQPIVDYNAATQTGFMYPPVNIKNGARCSSYTCALKPAMSRQNLRVLIDALVSTIIVDAEKKATGVEYIKQSEKCVVKARKEVIVSGGVYNSPQLLLLSGIGPKETLEKFSIDKVVDLPGVGQNLQDHQTIGGQMYTLDKKVSLNSVRYRTKKYLDEWYANGTGPMTVPAAFEGIAFYQSKLVRNVTDYPDVEVYFDSDNLFYMYKNFINPLYPFVFPKPYEDVITFFPVILRPKSRGYVTLRSKDPKDHPIINSNYLSHSDDIETLVEALKFVKRLVNTRAFQKYGPKLVLGGIIPNCILLILDSDEYLKCVAKEALVSFNHPSSTCKMGPSTDPMAVVDNRLRVHGVKNLRVADASIMPNVVTGHPNAVCMMIGEKVSDMIIQDNQG